MAQASRWEPLDDVITDRTKLPLEVLREVAKYQRYLSAIERRTVQAARAEGRTWDEIGAASGVTRQASWKRWGRNLVRLAPLDRGAAPDLGQAGPTPAVRTRRWVIAIGTFADTMQVWAPFRTGEEVEIVVDDEDLRRRVVDFASGLVLGTGGRLGPLGDGRYLLSPPEGWAEQNAG
jgi:hypothetical protein